MERSSAQLVAWELRRVSTAAALSQHPPAISLVPCTRVQTYTAWSWSLDACHTGVSRLWHSGNPAAAVHAELIEQTCRGHSQPHLPSLQVLWRALMMHFECRLASMQGKHESYIQSLNSGHAKRLEEVTAQHAKRLEEAQHAAALRQQDSQVLPAPGLSGFKAGIQHQVAACWV